MARSANDLPQPELSIRAEYERQGARQFYQHHGGAYRNPHETIIARCLAEAVKRWPADLSHVLDLAAGCGEVTLALRGLGAGRIDGIDPFTFEAYHQRTGQIAEQLTFEDIAAGALAGRRYSLLVCSFALHLCEPSRLPRVMHQLGQVCDELWILSPHKRPIIPASWGWKESDHFIIDRVHTRRHLWSNPDN